MECLCVLDNANLGGPQDASVQVEALLLGEEDGAFLLAWLRGHEHSLVDVGIELLASFRGVESLKAVLLQCVDQDAVGHLDTLVQRGQILVIAFELLRGNGGEGAVEVIDRLNEVAGEALDGEVLGGLGLTRCALLEVAEVGDGAEVLVLPSLSVFVHDEMGGCCCTFRSTISLSFLSSCSFNCADSSLGASSFFSAASPSFAAGASEYHLMAGAAIRVLATCCLMGAKAAGRTTACLEARRRLLWNIVTCDMWREMEEDVAGLWA